MRFEGGFLARERGDLPLTLTLTPALTLRRLEGRFFARERGDLTLTPTLTLRRLEGRFFARERGDQVTKRHVHVHL